MMQKDDYCYNITAFQTKIAKKKRFLQPSVTERLRFKTATNDSGAGVSAAADDKGVEPSGAKVLATTLSVTTDLVCSSSSSCCCCCREALDCSSWFSAASTTWSLRQSLLGASP
uniref:Uncharacterized protein n=1 Tax=Romanomermis culicivorax TaxID=13658 RepID=A0A915IIT7_ROMCU